MGKPVTVDSDDVEVLLHASYVGKEVEKILSVIRNDPAMIRIEAKGQIETAHRRINKARADAIRPPEDRDPSYGMPPQGDTETNMMTTLAKNGGIGIVADVRDWDSLRDKGLVVMGNASTVIKWGDGEQQATPDDRLRVRMTQLAWAWAATEKIEGIAHRYMREEIGDGQGAN